MNTMKINIRDTDTKQAYSVDCHAGSSDQVRWTWNGKHKKWIKDKVIPYIQKNIPQHTIPHKLVFTEIMTTYTVKFTRVEILTFLQTMLDKDKGYSWNERIILQSIRDAIINSKEPFELFNKKQ